MRLMFGVVGLLLALAIVAMLAKRQLGELRLQAGVSASSPAPGGTPAQQSQALQRRIGDDVKKALEQGASRGEPEGER